MTNPSEAISTRTATHYTWGENCDGWHLVRAPGLSVIQERMPAGTAEVRHWHGAARQFFYVLAGELTLELDGATTVVPAGHGCEVAPGVAHQVLNSSDAAVDFLVISQPPAQGDRVAAPTGPGSGLRPEDNDAGAKLSLAQLAQLLDRPGQR